jgi:hypothetical protein
MHLDSVFGTARRPGMITDKSTSIGQLMAALNIAARTRATE